MAVFAQALSRMRHNTLGQDAKLFFALGNSLMDSSISSGRPSTRTTPGGRSAPSAPATRGKGQLLARARQGLRDGPRSELAAVPGADRRHPGRSPSMCLGTAPSAPRAGPVLLQFYNNYDAFDSKVVIKARTSKIEPDVAPSKDITITWKTLIDAADDAGWSRRWGGIHFYSGPAGPNARPARRLQRLESGAEVLRRDRAGFGPRATTTTVAVADGHTFHNTQPDRPGPRTGAGRLHLNWTRSRYCFRQVRDAGGGAQSRHIGAGSCPGPGSCRTAGRSRPRRACR